MDFFGDGSFYLLDVPGVSTLLQKYTQHFTPQPWPCLLQPCHQPLTFQSARRRPHRRPCPHHAYNIRSNGRRRLPLWRLLPPDPLRAAPRHDPLGSQTRLTVLTPVSLFHLHRLPPRPRTRTHIALLPRDRNGRQLVH